MVTNRDLHTLRSFNSRGGITVSAYLRLDTPKNRESAHDEFVCMMQEQLEKCNPQPECREAIKEDLEIVSLYLKTNGHRQHAGLAIFSCASELFWRAYPLSTAVPNHVAVGQSFDIGPLAQLDIADLS